MSPYFKNTTIPFFLPLFLQGLFLLQGKLPAPASHWERDSPKRKVSSGEGMGGERVRKKRE